MKVLLVHDRYQQRGGEDRVFDSEVELLRERGIDHATHVVDNQDIPKIGNARVALGSIWSRASQRQLEAVVARERPTVVHFHNTFPLLSPSAYRAARSSGARVVQTLHNARLVCPKATLTRDGRACEDCVGRPFAWPSIVHRCYRESAAQSAVVATGNWVHRELGTLRRDVDAFIALSAFARALFVRGGLAPERITVKPNFLLRDPGVGAHAGGFALFVGRLSEEKGVEPLLDAWARAADLPPLKIVGDGPMRARVERRAAGHARIAVLGARTTDEVQRLMAEATVLIVPSICYEGCPMAVLEALAAGLPIVASGHGGLPEIVREGREGWLARPGDPADLAKVVAAATADAAQLRARSASARAAYEARFSADSHLHEIMKIYHS